MACECLTTMGVVKVVTTDAATTLGTGALADAGDDETELANLPQAQPRPKRRRDANAAEERADGHAEELTCDRNSREEESHVPTLDEHPRVDGHSDRHEEHRRKYVAERSNQASDDRPLSRLGDQRPREERSQRDRVLELGREGREREAKSDARE